MALFTDVRHLWIFNIVAPINFHLCQMFGRRRTPSAWPFMLMFRIDRPIALVRSILVIPGPSRWFFHFGGEILIACTQQKTTILDGTEPHHSSWQCKESHRCCHGPLVPLAMGDSGTSSTLTRYESMWSWLSVGGGLEIFFTPYCLDWSCSPFSLL